MDDPVTTFAARTPPAELTAERSTIHRISGAQTGRDLFEIV